MEILKENKVRLYRGLKIVLLVFLVVCAINILTDFPHNRYGDRVENTISLSGHGEVKAVPDIANVYFTISKDSKTVKDAQAAVASVEKKALDFLNTSNVALKDVKTSDASFYPKYENKASMPCTRYGCPGTGNSVIVGYTASESITVKVRNTDDVGKIMQGLGTLGVSNLNGPNFSIDNEDALKAQARKKAIDDAKAKASVLARDLGVHLGKIVSFTESGNYPVMYAAKGMMADSVSSAPAPAELPKGENNVSSDVTITYQIR